MPYDVCVLNEWGAVQCSHETCDKILQQNPSPFIYVALLLCCVLFCSIWFSVEMKAFSDFINYLSGFDATKSWFRFSFIRPQIVCKFARLYCTPLPNEHDTNSQIYPRNNATKQVLLQVKSVWQCEHIWNVILKLNPWEQFLHNKCAKLS